MSVEIRAKEILKRLPPNPLIAELGVYRGALSALLLQSAGRLVMVDSWGKHLDHVWEGSSMDAFILKREYAILCDAAKAATEFASDRRLIVRDFTLRAAAQFADGYFDCVFIDADHSYQAVKSDIWAWRNKVKLGGYLCGHDYGTRNFPGVTQAVDESFTVETGEDSTWFHQIKEAVCA